MFAFGIFIMVMGTYANMYLTENVSGAKPQSWKNLDSIKMPPDPVLKPAELQNINPLAQGMNEFLMCRGGFPF